MEQLNYGTTDPLSGIFSGNFIVVNLRLKKLTDAKFGATATN